MTERNTLCPSGEICLDRAGCAHGNCARANGPTFFPLAWKPREPQPMVSIELASERPKGLFMFNPQCAHDRSSYDVVTCPECQAYSDAHWADKIDFPGGRNGSA